MEADPFPQRTPCPFDDCQISAEEHHRLTRGLVAENAVLRSKIRQPDVLDLSGISTNDLLTEIARRINKE